MYLLEFGARHGGGCGERRPSLGDSGEAGCVGVRGNAGRGGGPPVEEASAGKRTPGGAFVAVGPWDQSGAVEQLPVIIVVVVRGLVGGGNGRLALVPAGGCGNSIGGGWLGGTRWPQGAHGLDGAGGRGALAPGEF
jgi:hypothetical protein